MAPAGSHPSRKLRPSPENLKRLVTLARWLYEHGAGSDRLHAVCVTMG